MRAMMMAAAACALCACETLSTSFSPPAAAETPATSAAPVAIAAPSAQQQLLEAERQLSTSALSNGLGPALAASLDAGGFVVRPGQMLAGPEAVTQGLPANASGPIYWQPDRIEVASSADMAMTSGRYVQVVRGAEAIQGRYVVVWRKDATGQWRVLSETRTADPPAARVVTPARRRR